jgi:hypothetical protein
VQQAEQILYEPGGERFINGTAGLPNLNIWKDDRVKPDNTEHQWFIDHIKYLMKEEEAEHFLNWLAYAVQNPGQKIMHAVLIIGGQGIGKSIMFNLFRQLFGPTNARAPQNENLSDKYTKWAKNTCFCLINELKQDGNNFFYNAIKPFITEDSIEIREMYRDPYIIRNTMNILAFSNDEAPIRLEDADRRWYVIKSEAARKDDKYYEKFIKYCENNAGGVLQYLLDRDLSQFNHGALPSMTEAKQDIIDHSKSDFELWVKSELDGQNGLFVNDIISVRDIMEQLPPEFRSKFITHKGTAKILRKYGAKKIDKAIRVGIDNTAKVFFIIRNKEKYLEIIENGDITKTVKNMYNMSEGITH